MIANMDAWVRTNTLPPASTYPKIADRTLVPLGDYALPAIPGLNRPHEANAAYRLDFGPRWTNGILSIQSPNVGQAFPVLVPQVDADGNERAGVRMPEITVPLATYTAWNLRDPMIGAPDQRVSFEGSYLPFPKNSAERQKTGDPRTAIAERYSGREDYMNRYANTVDSLMKELWIQPEDLEALMNLSEQEWTQNTH